MSLNFIFNYSRIHFNLFHFFPFYLLVYKAPFTQKLSKEVFLILKFQCMISLLSFLLSSILSLTPLQAAENEITIKVIKEDSIIAKRPIVLLVNDFFATELNDEIPNIPPQKYAQGLLYAQSMSLSDTGTHFKHRGYQIQLNNSIGYAGTSLSKMLDDPKELEGIGLNTLAKIDFPASSLFGPLFKNLSLSFAFMRSSPPPISSDLGGTITTYQLLARYYFHPHSSHSPLENVSFLTGFIKNRTELHLNLPILESIVYLSLHADFKGNLLLDTDVDLLIIPLLLSRNIATYKKMALFLQVGGYLLNGDSNLHASIKADITYTGSDSISEADYSIQGSASKKFQFFPTLSLALHIPLFSSLSLGLLYSKISQASSIGITFAYSF